MTTFITGGTTAIGRVLVKELVRQGEAMRILIQPNSNRSGLELPGVEFIRGDLTDAVAVRKGMTGCDRVCHLAAVVSRAVPESEWWRVNRDGSKGVLQVAHDMKIPSVVQVSSVAVLGPTRPGEKADEGRPVDPRTYFSLYQKTKRAADDIALEFADNGLEIKIVYPGFGYGYAAVTRYPTFADQTLLRAASGKSVSILGSGKNQLSLTHFSDIVQGILLAHEHGKSGEGYILGGETLTLPEVWAVIAGSLDQDPQQRRTPVWLARMKSNLASWTTGRATYTADFLEMIGRDWNFNSEKAKRELGWQPHTFQEGMDQTWEDYQAMGWGSDRVRQRVRADRVVGRG